MRKNFKVIDDIDNGIDIRRCLQTVKRVSVITDSFKALLPPALLDKLCELQKAIDDYNSLMNDYYYNLGYLQGKADYSLIEQKLHSEK